MGRVLLLLALIGSACTSLPVVGGEVRTVSIEAVEIVDDRTLVVDVVHNPCEKSETTVTESPDEVELWVGLRATARDCEDEGLETRLSLDLVDAVGERRLLLHAGATPIAPPCVWADGDGWCRDVTVVADGERVDFDRPGRDILGPGLTIDAIGRELDAGDGLRLLVRSERELVDPAIRITRRLEPPGDGEDCLDPPAPCSLFWGGVTVRNFDDSIALGEPYGTVAGHEAWWWRWPDSPRPDGLRIAVGAWWVDLQLSSVISLWGGDPEPGVEALERLVREVRIEDRGSEPPGLDHPWIGPTGEFLLVGPGDDGGGVSVSVDPGCREAPCQAGLGYLAGATEWMLDPLGLDTGWPRPPGYEESAAASSSVEVELVDLGLRGELVACDGPPAFDPALLPEDVDWDVVTSSTMVLTGHRNWAERSRDGIVTSFHGPSDAPIAVARYLDVGDGHWTTESVTACR